MRLEGRVLITGGSGSLGTAIIERGHAESWPCRFLVYSRDEVKQSVLRERFPDVEYRLGDVRDREALTRAMRDVETVVHAAAYKRVPEAERETIPCVQSNVDGSIAVIDASLRAGVARVVGISTDKACHPINAYGQSKAIMERLFQSVAMSQSTTRFHLVRYGNVLASRGSVIPTFQAQAAAGKRLTVTDPRMTRFWLTLDDAVDLVVAALDAEPGMILVPECRAASMLTVARAIDPYTEDAPGIGNRGAEKRHESLMNADEAPYSMAWGPGWLVRSMALAPLDEAPPDFAYTSDVAPQLDVDAMRRLILDMGEGRSPRTL